MCAASRPATSASDAYWPAKQRQPAGDRFARRRRLSPACAWPRECSCARPAADDRVRVNPITRPVRRGPQPTRARSRDRIRRRWEEPRRVLSRRDPEPRRRSRTSAWPREGSPAWRSPARWRRTARSDASDRAVRRRHGEEGKELRLILQPGDLAVQLRPTNPPRKARDSTTQIPQIRHDCFGAARRDSDDVPGDGARFCGLARALPVTTSAEHCA